MEIAAHKKILLFSFLRLRLRLLIFQIFVDFRVPLADPLGQIGSIAGRCWCNLGSNFPTFSAAPEGPRMLRKCQESPSNTKMYQEHAEISWKQSETKSRQTTLRQRTTDTCQDMPEIEGAAVTAARDR